MNSDETSATQRATQYGCGDRTSQRILNNNDNKWPIAKQQRRQFRATEIYVYGKTIVNKTKNQKFIKNWIRNVSK